MRKTVFALLLIFISQLTFSQVNEPANWPNSAWELNGVFEPATLLGNPTQDPNFGFDDFDAGGSSIDNLLAESPTIDITPAISSGENFLEINSTYVFVYGLVGDSLTIQYWDATNSLWTNWGDSFETTTAGAPDINFCDGPFVTFTTELLDISSFNALQLSEFRYRIVYDDGGSRAQGFCMNSPTLSSSTGPSACPDPLNITTSEITDSSVNVSWDIQGTEPQWEVIIQVQGTGIPTTNGEVANTNVNFNSSGLNADTDYEIFVRANCLGNGFSGWVGPVNFRTLRTPPAEPVGVTCSSGSPSIIFMEDFGLVPEEAPLGWTGTGFDGDEFNGGDWSITIAGVNTPETGPQKTWDNNSTSGVHLEYEALGNATDIASAISPPIDMTAAIDGAELSFFMHAYGASIGTLEVGVSNSATGPFVNVFTWNGELQTDESQDWVPVGVDLNAYTGQIIYLEFAYGGLGISDRGDLALDTIKVESCGDFCIMPSDIVVNNITTTSTDISWTSNGLETNWEYVVQPAGTGLPAANGEASASTTINVTALNPETEYEIYVRANCLANGFSLWEGPIPFTTRRTPPMTPQGVTCTNGILTDIFSEDFGSAENTDPMGWTGTGFIGNILNGNWRITNPDDNSFNTGPFDSWDSNSGVHLEYAGAGSATDVATAITPAIDLTGATGSAELSFFMHAFGSSIGELNVGISLSATGPFNPIFSWDGGLQIADTDAWVPVGINLDEAIGAIFYLEFSYSGSGTGNEADLAIDQIKVESCIESCTAPRNVVANNITTTGIDFSWVANGSETNWEYVVQPADRGEPTGNGMASTVTNANVNTLDPATAYEVYVRANCLSDGFSSWVGPLRFLTLNSSPPPPPNGVTCSTGSANVAFEEEFGTVPNTTPSGWSGTDFSGASGKWRISNPDTNSTGSGPLNSWDGSSGVHLEYETTGNTTNIDSAITPAIDLSAAVDGAELSFYMHAFGSGIGVLNVGVSTSATGPFSTEFSWAGELQVTDAEAWVPVGVSLDAYLGQTIFIEFSYG